MLTQASEQTNKTALFSYFVETAFAKIPLLGDKIDADIGLEGCRKDHSEAASDRLGKQHEIMTWHVGPVAQLDRAAVS